MAKLARQSSSQGSSENVMVLLGLVIIAAIGLGCGFSQVPDPGLPSPVARLSAIIGWTYFACWSLSFYPQVFDNWRRKSVEGLSFDFLIYNLLGHSSYAIFNCAFYYSTTVQDIYKEQHQGSTNDVQANDVFFSLHAVLITLITVGQCFVYSKTAPQLSRTCALVVSACVVGCGGYSAVVLYGPSDCGVSIMSVLYALSYLKLSISLYKYLDTSIRLVILPYHMPPCFGPFALFFGSLSLHGLLLMYTRLQPATLGPLILPFQQHLYFKKFCAFLISFIAPSGLLLLHFRPQVILNHTRRSTVGWSIHNVLLDISGGLLSLLQLLIDCSAKHDWNAVTGNPVKFGLGFISLFFDAIFTVQHYVLFRDSWTEGVEITLLDKLEQGRVGEGSGSDVRQPLLVAVVEIHGDEESAAAGVLCAITVNKGKGI